MFQSPISNIANWNFEPVRLTVPTDKKLRYPNYLLKGLRIIKGDAIPEQVSLPVLSNVKISVTTDETWIELEPILIRDPAFAKRFTMGFPSIYLVLPVTTTGLTDGLMSTAESLGDFAGFSLAFQFGDRVERDVHHATKIILDALLDDADPTWENFCSALLPTADIHLLSANGMAFTSPIRLRFETGGTVNEFDYTPTSSLQQLTGNQAGILRIAGTPSNATENPLWVNTDASGILTVSYVETSLTADTRVLLLADLHQWFGVQTIEDPEFAIPRYTLNNHVTTYVNGPEYFRDVFRELNEAAI